MPGQGLIPALSKGPRRSAVESARDRFLAPILKESHEVASLVLHRQNVEAGSRVARPGGPNGELKIRFPDKMTSRVNHRSQLTYAGGRDVVSVVDQAMDGAVSFMESMIDAFEIHYPERFRTRNDEDS
jgi:hypothetical protein